MGQDGPNYRRKLPKMAKNCKKCPKMSKNHTFPTCSGTGAGETGINDHKFYIRQCF